MMHQLQVRTKVTTLMLALLGAAITVVSLPASTQAVAASSPPRAVVLGDSHASGEGGGSYFPETDTATNRCRRSPNGWAGQLQSMGLMKLSAYPACAGAKIENVLTTGQYGEPAQITAIP